MEIFDESTENPQSTSPFTLSSGDGHDFAGTVISFDGLESGTVREESALDFWSNVELNNSSVEHHGTPDMKTHPLRQRTFLLEYRRRPGPNRHSSSQWFMDFDARG